MIRAWSREPPSSSTTRSTRERSASPEYEGGVSTQQKSSSAFGNTSSIAVVKVSREEFFSISADSPGSKIGTSPRASDSTFSRTMSRTYTSWPSSAKQAAVTRPTQPAPMTPIGSRESFIRGSSLLSAERLARPRDRAQGVFRERLEQRVRDPVGRVLRLPGDQPHALAVLEDHELPAAVRRYLRRALDDRRVLPARSLQPVVLAEQRVLRDHHPVALKAVPMLAADPVGAGRVDRERRARHPDARVVDLDETRVLGDGQGLLATRPGYVDQTVPEPLLDVLADAG